MNENIFQREALRRVDFKVQDLELKINVLTYKIHHGLWTSHAPRLKYDENNYGLAITNSDGDDYSLKCIDSTREIKSKNGNLNINEPGGFKNTCGDSDKIGFLEKEESDPEENEKWERLEERIDENSEKLGRNNINKLRKRLEGLQVVLRDFRGYENNLEEKKMAKEFLQELNSLKIDNEIDENLSRVKEKNENIVEEKNVNFYEEKIDEIPKESLNNYKGDKKLTKKNNDEQKKEEKPKNFDNFVDNDSELPIVIEKKEKIDEIPSVDLIESHQLPPYEHDEITMFPESPLSQIESILQKSMSWNNMIDERSDDSSDSDDKISSTSVINSFPSETLDIISEEQSGSSCNERSSNTVIDIKRNGAEAHENSKNKKMDRDEVEEMSNNLSLDDSSSFSDSEHCNREKGEKTFEQNNGHDSQELKNIEEKKNESDDNDLSSLESESIMEHFAAKENSEDVQENNQDNGDLEDTKTWKLDYKNSWDRLTENSNEETPKIFESDENKIEENILENKFSTQEESINEMEQKNLIEINELIFKEEFDSLEEVTGPENCENNLIDLDDDEDQDFIKYEKNIEDFLKSEINLLENNNEIEIVKEKSFEEETSEFDCEMNELENCPNSERTVITSSDLTTELSISKQEIFDFNIEQENSLENGDFIQLENSTFKELKELEECWNTSDLISEKSTEIVDKSTSNLDLITSSTNLTMADTSSLIFASDYCLVESIESVKPPKEIKSIGEIDFFDKTSEEIVEKKSADKIDETKSNDIFIIENEMTIKSQDSMLSKTESFDSGNSTYLDASSRNILNSSRPSLSMEKSELSLNKIPPRLTRKSIKCSSTPTLPRASIVTQSRASLSSNFPSDNKKRNKYIKSLETEEIKTEKTFKKCNLPSKKIGSLKTKSNLNLSCCESQKQGVAFGRSSVDLTQRRSRSYVTPRKYDQEKINNSPSMSSKSKIALPDRRSNLKLKLSNQDLCQKSKENLSRFGSKSSIPLLRTRFENLKATEPENHEKNEGNNSARVSTIELQKASEQFLDRDVESWEKKDPNVPENQTVIYVNIVTENENSVTKILDTKTFFDYIKDRDLKIQRIIDDDLSDKSLKSEDSLCPKIRTVVSTIINEKPSVEVLAKPSVNDISTSISDLSEKNINKIKSPLTKEEYISLYEVLKEDENFCQLDKLQELRKIPK